MGGSIVIDALNNATLKIDMIGGPHQVFGIGVSETSLNKKLDLTFSGKAMVTVTINSNASSVPRAIYSINLPSISDTYENTFSIIDDAGFSSSVSSSLKDGTGYTLIIKGTMNINTTGDVYILNAYTTNNWPLVAYVDTFNLIKVKKLRIEGNSYNTAEFMPLAVNTIKNFADDICITIDYDKHLATYVHGGCAISVLNGEADKTLANAKDVITITADAPPDHLLFNKWVTEDVTLADETSPTTTFVMPHNNVFVKATYKDNPAAKFNVYVTSGSGSGDYFPLEEVSIQANTIAGKVFDQWQVSEGVSLKDGLKAASTSFIMPNKDVVISALYKDIVYSILEGADQNLQKDKLTDLVLKSDGDLKRLDGIRIDGKLIDGKHYKAEAGSIIITIFKEYLASLTNGKHSVEILFSDGGKASTSFSLAAAPAATDDDKEPVNKEPVEKEPVEKKPVEKDPVEKEVLIPETGNQTYSVLALLLISLGWVFLEKSCNDKNG